MRVKNLLWSLLGVMAFSACSSDNEVFDESNNNPDVNSESRFMAVEIMNPSNLKRAADDGYGTDYEKGEDTENNVSSLRFYFFDKGGNAVTVNKGVNYVEVQSNEIQKNGEQPDNVELKLKAILVINTQNGDNANVNTMLAVANYADISEDEALGTNSLSLEQLQAKIGKYTSAHTDNKFLMTSSSYVGADGPVSVATIEPKHLCTSIEEAKDSPVEIYIERLVAKTRLNVTWEVMTTKEVTYNDNTYTAIKLQDKNNKDIEIDNKQVYVIFTGWNVTNTANKSYLIKKVDNWNKLEWSWNDAGRYRSYWAMNPITDKDFALTYDKSYNDVNLKLGDHTYCFENAADNEDGTKSAYNPEEKVSNRTQVLIAAVLVTIDDSNTAKAISLAKWAGSDYTVESVKTAMYNQVTSVIYYETTQGTPSAENPRTFNSILPTHVTLATGIDAEEADTDSENSKRYLSYLQLTTDAENIQFYTAAVKNVTTTNKSQDDINKEIDATKYKDAAAVNTELAKVPGAKVWNSGMTYYYTDLQHLGNADEKGKYGVVRNHIYDVKINSVKGLGTPVYEADEVIIPQKPKDDDTFIAARINVLSWRIVPNNVDLVW